MHGKVQTGIHLARRQCTGNHLHLTGLRETAPIDQFRYGLSDRGASIRMPVNFIKHGYKGYLEGRRPNSEADPYQIVERILGTIDTVPVRNPVSQFPRRWQGVSVQPGQRHLSVVG